MGTKKKKKKGALPRRSLAASKQGDIWKQLMKLRALTQELGVIHEAQKMQLQLWGPLALPHCHDIEIHIQLPYLGEEMDDQGAISQKLFDANTVEFRALAAEKPPKDLPKRLDGLCRSVRSMLGDYFDVGVKINGVPIFIKKGSLKPQTDMTKLITRLRGIDGTDE